MPTRYMQNRELAWLRFNERVLVEAEAAEVPLLEKLKFIAIFTSNLDEFFMVRVGTLHDLMLMKKHKIDSKSDMTAAQQIDAILAMMPSLYQKRDRIYQTIMSDLRDFHIRQLRFSELNEEQKTFANRFFKQRVDELISPQIIDMSHPLPFLENKRHYILTELEKDDQKMFGLLPIREDFQQVLTLPGHQVDYILTEELILEKIEKIFNGYKVLNKGIIAVTRNTDLNTDNENQDMFDNYRDFMKAIVKKRKRLNIVRLESQGPLSETSKAFLFDKLGLDEDHYLESQTPLSMEFVFNVMDIVPSAVKNDMLYPKINAYNPYKNTPSIIEKIRQEDQLLSYPYDDIDAFVALLKEIAEDPQCRAIKITIYRLASQSKIAEQLIKAAENGIDVTVLMELKARFDEESNIQYASILEKAGCNVIYGFEEFKTHSKVFLAIFKDSSQNIHFITQLGTGNYNEKTSRIYTDFSLLTANTEIGLDANDFFTHLALGNLNGKYKHLLQAPSSLRQQFVELIDREIAKGKDGYLFFKCNSFTDKVFIDKLVEASQAGCTIKLIIRGITCLLPGVEGVTDNIEIHSIVGRYLEHPRVYFFGKDDQMAMYISSADLMTRNMEERVEIAAPVYDKKIQKRIMTYMTKQFSDTLKGRKISPEGEFLAIPVVKGQKAFSSQDAFIDEAEKQFQRQLRLESVQKVKRKSPLRKFWNRFINK